MCHYSFEVGFGFLFLILLSSFCYSVKSAMQLKLAITAVFLGFFLFSISQQCSEVGSVAIFALQASCRVPGKVPGRKAPGGAGQQ